MTTATGTMMRSFCAAALLPAFLGGCFGVADRPVAGLEPAVEDTVAAPPIRTVRSPGSRVAAAAEPRADALPTAAEIFDFHPPGSKPDAWRQPFLIDPNDGPLAGYVRRMDAELGDSNRQTQAAAAAARPVRKRVCPSSGPAGAIATACVGENDVARKLAQ